MIIWLGNKLTKHEKKLASLLRAMERNDVKRNVLFERIDVLDKQFKVLQRQYSRLYMKRQTPKAT